MLFGTGCRATDDNINKYSDTPFVEEVAEPLVYVDGKIPVTLYLPNADYTEFVKKEVFFEGNIQKEIIEYLLFNQFESQISIPDGTTIKRLDLWNETLNIDFSKEAEKNLNIQGTKKEWYIIGSVVNSLLENSDQYTDVQFLVNGERVDNLFGEIDTSNPFMEFH